MQETYYIESGTDVGLWEYADGSGLLWHYFARFGRPFTPPVKHGFFVFRDIDIPKGATIESCILSVYSGFNSYGETCRGRITFVAADSPEPPEDADEAEALAETTAYVDWVVDSEWEWHSKYNTPDLKTILQEIIDRDGWAPGNSICILIHDNGSDQGAQRDSNDFDSFSPFGKVEPSELGITFESGAGGDNGEPTDTAAADGLFLYDRADVGWGLATGSTLTLADTATNLLSLIVNEWLTLIDAQHNNWNGREIVIQPLNLYDIISLGKIFTDSVNDGVALADTSLWRLTISVLEYMRFSALASAMKSTASASGDTITLADSANRAFPVNAESVLSCVDTATVLAAFIGAASSELSLRDESSLTKMMRMFISSPMVFADSIANTGVFYNALYDTLAMNVLIELDGEIYECYALSTPKFLPSMYSGFDFNSYCVFENRAYGANSTGIYELTGETDAGNAIHTGVVLHDTDFGTHNFKRFRKGYMGISGQSPVMILETEDGTRRVYTISDAGRTTASHEQKSKKWKISIAEFDNLDTIQLVPIILTR